LRVGFLLAALLSIANGIWMLVDPSGWFELVPGPASDYGPRNSHFIQDVGGWYVAGGVLFLFASTNPRRFGGVTLIVMLLANGAHAISHLVAVLSGRVEASHWATDMPVVLGPAIVLALLLWVWWSLVSSTEPGRRPQPAEVETAEEPAP
jgi:hypothetical protein